jgi:RimJ/RimL family protein N-acetyltransferase
MNKQKLKIGQLVQLNPHLVRNKSFAGCIMVVTESFDWGAQGYVQALGKENSSVPGGQAYYKAKWDEMEPVGFAAWTMQFILFRPATLDDAQILLEWRNDSVTREASHNIGLIKEDEHLQWLKQLLINKNRKLHIAIINGIPVGAIRMDLKPNGYEISWTVSPAKRGSGIGKAIVGKFTDDITDSIYAEIKSYNVASIRIAEFIGMLLEREENGIRYYRRDNA